MDGVCCFINKFSIFPQVEPYSSVFSLWSLETQFHFAVAQPFAHLADAPDTGDGDLVVQVQTQQIYQRAGEPVGLYRQFFAGQNNPHAAVSAGQAGPETLQRLSRRMLLEK